MTENTNTSLSFTILAQATQDFNTISGSLANHSEAAFKLQRDLVIEEATELSDGFDNKDLNEQLDGAVDTLVTALGYLQKLEATYGIDVGRAMELVGENNLSKYPKTEDEVLESIKHYADLGIKIVWEYNDDYKVYILKDAITGKVKKPVNFKAVDLSVCFPTKQ